MIVLEILKTPIYTFKFDNMISGKIISFINFIIFVYLINIILFNDSFLPPVSPTHKKKLILDLI